MELPQTQETKHGKNKTVLAQGQMLQQRESSYRERNSKNGADSSSQRCLTLLPRMASESDKLRNLDFQAESPQTTFHNNDNDYLYY